MWIKHRPLLLPYCADPVELAHIRNIHVVKHCGGTRGKQNNKGGKQHSLDCDGVLCLCRLCVSHMRVLAYIVTMVFAWAYILCRLNWQFVPFSPRVLLPDVGVCGAECASNHPNRFTGVVINANVSIAEHLEAIDTIHTHGTRVIVVSDWRQSHRALVDVIFDRYLASGYVYKEAVRSRAAASTVWRSFVPSVPVYNGNKWNVPRLLRNVSVVVCTFGILGRGTNTSWPTIEAFLLNPLLEWGAALDVVAVDLDPRGQLVDGVPMQAGDWQRNMGPWHPTIKRTTVDDVDRAIDCSQGCQMRDYSTARMVRAMRQLYAEQMVADYLVSQSHADIAVVCGPDFVLDRQISYAGLAEATTSQSSVWTTTVNDGAYNRGITNGFYYGQRAVVAAVAARYKPNLNVADDYENYFRAAFEKHKVTRRIDPLQFKKARHNGQMWG